MGLRAAEAGEALRSTFRLATEGRMVTAWERTSQACSRSVLPRGLAVTRSCGGRLVNAPLATMESRVFDAICAANGPKVA
jgi:hypothetical protein